MKNVRWSTLSKDRRFFILMENKAMKILCVGDVVGQPGRAAVINLIPKYRQENDIQCVVVNGENAAGGSGITGRIARSFFHNGVDVITLGDHTWDQKDAEVSLREIPNLIRPANFPVDESIPGVGFTVFQAPGGCRIGVMNLLGRTFMRPLVDCPFRKARQIIQELKEKTDVILLDFHAETTSEKVAMGHWLDGQVSAVFGTHTHVQTADEWIMPGQTAYITDLGMTGPYDSVIGQEKEAILARFLTSMPRRFSVAKNNVKLCGVVIEINEKIGKAIQISRVQIPYEVSADVKDFQDKE